MQAVLADREEQLCRNRPRFGMRARLFPCVFTKARVVTLSPV